MNHKGVYHFDIKSENLLLKEVNGEFDFKIVDFGHTYSEKSNSVSL